MRLLFLLFSLSASLSAAAEDYSPPGSLESNSGTGYSATTIFQPGMRFPLEKAEAYANSQVYRKGGMYGGGGSQCDAKNYSMPWRDNFCEKRSRPTPMCPSGQGHQGQDIRPATCHANRHWAVAAEDGIITNIGSYSVTLQGKSGTLYRYLHMDGLTVSALDKVNRGEKIGRVSNTFGGTPTTIHLHFEIKKAVNLNGRRLITFVPPYTSLIAARRALISGDN